MIQDDVGWGAMTQRQLTFPDQGIPHHVVIRIMNKGRDHIQRADYEEPVTFICRSLAIDAWIGDKRAGTLNPVAVLHDERLSYEPLLLNRRDWFDLEGIIVDSMGGPLRFVLYEGRVAGVEEIENWAQRTERRTKAQRIAGLLGSVLLLTASVVALTTADIPRLAWAAVATGIAVLILGLAVLFAVLGLIRPGRLVDSLRRRSRPTDE